MKITLENLSKTYGLPGKRVAAAEDIDLCIDDGEFFVLLGPSGSGKSTLLSLIAGLEKPTGGTIRFDDTVVACPARRVFVPPRLRNVAMVFQSYALYPHLDVFENIAFPLRVGKAPKSEIPDRVRGTADMLEIADLLDRRPKDLSGGQRQRVAIGRALVRSPSVLLLDEPLSNLDVMLRLSTRTELKRLHDRLRITTVYVTHDQSEAMTLGTRIALLDKGRLVQVDTPQCLYQNPATAFAGKFIGSPPMNLIECERPPDAADDQIRVGDQILQIPPDLAARVRALQAPKFLLGIRPERLVFDPPETYLRFQVTIETTEYLGREHLVSMSLNGQRLVALAEAAAAQHQGLAVVVGVDSREVTLFPSGTAG